MVPKAENIVYSLLQPRTLAFFAALWIFVTVFGTGLAIITTSPQVVFGGTRAEAAAPSWLVEFEQTDFSMMPDARIAMEEAEAKARNEQATRAAQVLPVLPTRIVVESIGMDLTVANPTSTDVDVLDAQLTSAVVRYPGSANLASADGNMLIFGHSSYLPIVHNKMYKAFNEIQSLKTGARISVYGEDGMRYDYAVTSVRHASAEEDSIPIATEKKLTLLTCDTFGKKTDRWIVEARPL